MPLPTILRGDDTELRGTTITITLPEADFTGLRVVWQFCGITRAWDAPASGATLAIDLSSNETARLPLGTHMATISVLNANHVGYVVTNTLRIRVTDDVADATGVDNAIVINYVEVARGLDLDGIDDNPTTPNALKAAFAELLSRMRAAASMVATASVLLLWGGAVVLADGLTLTKAPSGSLPFDAPVVTDATYTPPPETDPTVPEWAKSPTPPLTQESDPTVPAWAKSPTPPVTEEADPFFAEWSRTNKVADAIANALFANAAGNITNRSVVTVDNFGVGSMVWAGGGTLFYHPGGTDDFVAGDEVARKGDLSGFLSFEVDPIFTAWKPKREYHADSWTNIVWKNVYSNGWVFLVPYSNNLGDAE